MIQLRVTSLSLLRHGPHTDETSCLSIFFFLGGSVICTKTSILCCSEEEFCLFIQVYIKKKVHWCNEVSHLFMSQSLFFCTSYFVIITMITLVTQLARPTNIADNCKHFYFKAFQVVLGCFIHLFLLSSHAYSLVFSIHFVVVFRYLHFYFRTQLHWPHVFKSSFHYIIISVFSQIIQDSFSAQLSAQDFFSNKRLFMVAVLF